MERAGVEFIDDSGPERGFETPQGKNRGSATPENRSPGSARPGFRVDPALASRRSSQVE
jgi:hypothetical protein